MHDDTIIRIKGKIFILIKPKLFLSCLIYSNEIKTSGYGELIWIVFAQIAVESIAQTRCFAGAVA